MTDPAISTFAPTTGSALGPSTQVGFSVTSVAGLLRVFVVVRYPGIGITELVHDGTVFTPAYASGSSRSAIAGGFSYLISRVPIWPDAPAFSVYAENVIGGETLASGAYTLVAPPPLPSPPTTVPTVPTTGTTSQAPVTQHDSKYFLGFFDRNFDPGWLQPLKAQAQSGYEILQAFASVGARISTAISRLEAGQLILYASGGSLATGLVEFLRPTHAAGAVTVAKGTVVTTSNSGRDFVTLADAAFGSTDLGPIAVAIQAVAPGWQWNVRGQAITARGEVLSGDIDTVRTFIQLDPANPLRAPTFVDATIACQNIVGPTGGADPMLDGLGADRGVIRRPGELDPPYRLRIRTLPDTVSPAAILRQVQAFLQPYGGAFAFIETFEQPYQTCWDAPSPNPGTPGYTNPLGVSAAFSNLFTFDDPRPADPFRNRWLDSVDMRGTFIIVVPNLSTRTEYGSPWDDTVTTNADTEIPPPVNGQRALAAWDLPDIADLPGFLPWCWDGLDVQKNAIYAALWQLLQQLKAAGVTASLELQGFG